MIYKILKYPFFGRFMVEWINPLSESETKEWKRISVRSKSGGIIEGLFAKSRSNEAKATIVLGHPMGKEAKGYFLKRGYTDLLREDGFNVVVFDMNGFGESSNGNFSYFDDIIAIGIKAKELSPNLPIGYHGISLGAIWATIAFTDKNHVYNFAIIESAATTLAEFWSRFPLAYGVLKFLNFMLPRYKRKIEMVERIKEVRYLRSILLIYSRSDTWVPLEMGKRFQENSPVQAELWVVDKAKHAEIMKSPDKEAYGNKILKYFNLEVEKYKEDRQAQPHGTAADGKPS